MYQGFGKGDGGIVGEIADEDECDFMDICESASAEESLICRGTTAEGDESHMMVSARLCPLSGKVIWVKEKSESAILRRTVGMSQMTSMLHDKDRNDVYERAIKLSIQHFKRIHNRGPVVLDVGTGTGLLAMFASRHGAEHVVGCEMFETMASIAEQVIQTNKLGDAISICAAKSTCIESLPTTRKPDILISELLDSALLGESCIYSHADAISRFMDETSETEQDCKTVSALKIPLSQRVMPHSAQIFASLIESKEVEQMHDVSNICMHGFNPFRDEAASSCPGGWSLIPLQWSVMENKGGRFMSSTQKVLDFEFYHTFPKESMSHQNSEKEEQKEKEEEEEEDVVDEDDETVPYGFGEGCFESDVLVVSSGTVHGVLLWWKLFLLSPDIDPERSVWYTTKPGEMNWQDHWLQVVYPLPQSIECVAGDIIRVTSAHDTLRIWLKAEKMVTPIVNASIPTVVANHSQDTSLLGMKIPSFSTNALAQVIANTSSTADSNFNSCSRLSGIGNSAFQNKIENYTTLLGTESTDPGIDHSSESKAKKFKSSPSMTDSTHVMKDMVPVSAELRLQPSQCTCGWHLLCGVERIQCLNDAEKYGKWEAAITDLLRILKLSQESTANLNDTDQGVVHRVILDVSDGSILSIAAALKLSMMKEESLQDISASSSATSTSTCIDSLRIVSIERKDFSRMFHDRLVTSNDVDESVMLWDGEDWGDIENWLFLDEEEEEEEGKDSDKGDKDGNNDGAKNEGNDCVDSVPVLVTAENSNGDKQVRKVVKIAALIGECFYYQLHALPTWQALSFLYKRTEMDEKLEESALVLPGGAYVMAAAIELTDLSGTYGNAGIISGFDHRDLDKAQEDWHEHMFPYKLGGYRKKMLTKPIGAMTLIATLDYSSCVRDIEGVMNRSPVIADGRCDCIAVWVDYDLTPTKVSHRTSHTAQTDALNIQNIPRNHESENFLRQWDDAKQDFPSHLKLNLKFFPSALEVKCDVTYLTSVTSFTSGDSDFQYNFNFEHGEN